LRIKLWIVAIAAQQRGFDGIGAGRGYGRLHQEKSRYRSSAKDFHATHKYQLFPFYRQNRHFFYIRETAGLRVNQS